MSLVLVGGLRNNGGSLTADRPVTIECTADSRHHREEKFPMIRLLPVLAFAFGLPAGAAASPVDSANFSASSDSTLIEQSCKQLDISGTKLQGDCNKAADGSVSSQATELDLESYVTCNESNTLAWGSGGLSGTTGLDVDLSSTGSYYMLVGTCSGGDASELDLRSQITNGIPNGTANGELTYY